MKTRTILNRMIIFILLLSIIISIFSFSIVIAEDESNNCFYKAKEDITVYTNIDDNFLEYITIPHTYYFKVVSDITGYKKISYNNMDNIYISNNDLDTKAEITELTEITNPYYNIGSLTIPTKSQASYSYYKSNDFKTYTYDPSDLSSIAYLGVLVKNDTTYFLVDCVFNSVIISGKYYLPAIDIIENYSLSTIEIHPNSVVKPSTEINNNELENIPKNNLIRNILIIVVCILCVAFVFLIYQPGIKNNKRNSSNNYTNDDY